MLKQKIADTIHVSNLYIRGCEQIALLIVFLYSNSDVGLKTDEFVGLLHHDRHDVALLTLNTKLSDCCRKVTLLVGRKRRADY
jgi:hypothetical protein